MKAEVTVKSKRGAIKRRDAIIRQCYRDAEGGTQYGIDMPYASHHMAGPLRGIDGLERGIPQFAGLDKPAMPGRHGDGPETIRQETGP
jgi:hypothetical protein